MAKTVSVVITGDKEVNRMLHQLAGKEQKAVVRKAARTSIKTLLPTVRRNAPKDTGALRRSFTVRALTRSAKQFGARITTRGGLFQGKTFYGGFQEWGWKLGKRGTDGRRKIPGKFFMKRAADTKRRSVLTIYKSEIKIGVEAIVARNRRSGTR